MSVDQLTRREIKNLGRLKRFDRDTFYGYLTRVINRCEQMKTEMHDLRKKLKNDKKRAADLKKQGDFNKAGWTYVNCTILAFGTIGIFFPPFGLSALTVGVVGAIGSAGVTAGSKLNQNGYKKKTNKIINSVRKESDKCVAAAKKAIDKKNEFDEICARLIDVGLTEEQANVLVILTMIEDALKGRNQSSIPDQNASNLGNYACLGVTGLEAFTESDVIMGMASKFSENQENIFGYILKGIKNLAIEVPAQVIKKACVAAAYVAIIVNIHQLVKTCLKDGDAVIFIEEISETLDEGEHSLQFFINLLHYLKEKLLLQIKDSCQKECDQKIASYADRMTSYTATIEDLRSKVEAQATEIKELRNEFRNQALSQNQGIYSLFYCLQNGMQLPPLEEFCSSNWIRNQALTNSIDTFKNEQNEN